MFYKSLIKPFLFKKKTEDAHYYVFDKLQLAYDLPLGQTALKTMFGFKSPKLEREVFGLKFPNPVGLAAGFDKDAKLIDELSLLGFGFIEIGTVTPKPQEGNPRPRLFRLLEDQALINRMGFNNEGAEAAAYRLSRRTSKTIVGGNIGKNKVTPNELAIGDYEICFDTLYPYVDYFVVNVSSPNTPNLRELQEKEPLTKLLEAVMQKNRLKPKQKPVLLKIAPDLTEGQLDDIIEIVQSTGLAGIIATNTTVSREGLQTDEGRLEQIGMGGLSGKPLKTRSTEVIRYIHQKSGGKIDMIAAGGIFTAEDALEKLEAGAKLVQVYTGFVYEGPSMIKNINKGILKAMGEKP